MISGQLINWKVISGGMPRDKQLQIIRHKSTEAIERQVYITIANKTNRNRDI